MTHRVGIVLKTILTFSVNFPLPVSGQTTRPCYRLILCGLWAKIKLYWDNVLRVKIGYFIEWIVMDNLLIRKESMEHL